jgi:hypothetical protein
MIIIIDPKNVKYQCHITVKNNTLVNLGKTIKKNIIDKKVRNPPPKAILHLSTYCPKIPMIAPIMQAIPIKDATGS